MLPAAIELDSGATSWAAAGITKKESSAAPSAGAMRMNVLKIRRIVPNYVV
jgi:hypothetical protein